MNNNYDVIISGGGVIGGLAALVLAKNTSLSILVVEAKANNIDISSKSQFGKLDARVIAVSRQSALALQSLGINLEELHSQSIERIVVSDKGHVGQTQLLCEEAGIDYFGKVIEIDALSKVIQSKAIANPNVTFLNQAKITKAVRTLESVDLKIDSDNQTKETMECSAKLLLIADGYSSQTRQLLGVESDVNDYQQQALISNLVMQLPHKNCAFERFTENGPYALLPMFSQTFPEQTMSMVWCANKAKIEGLLQQSEKEFCQSVREQFSDRLGNILSFSKRYVFPVALNKTEHFVSHRTLCLGNAAQSLHPIAGQGFNLGLRDVMVLSEIIDNKDIGDFTSLQSYQQAQKDDKRLTINATDALVRLFSNQLKPLTHIRSNTLCLLNHSAFIKQNFARFAMGNRGRL